MTRTTIDKLLRFFKNIVENITPWNEKGTGFS